ncbi:Zinc finger BED domain-containing protein RICESLEEPER 1 [Bienertia sinuspersici]
MLSRISALNTGNLDMMKMRDGTAHWIMMHEKAFSAVFTILADNATTNDSFIKILKETFSLTKRSICGGNLLHVQCSSHILNIMVQHGLKQVKSISRMFMILSKLYGTTYDMLACAIKFKKVFSRLTLEAKEYIYCPSADHRVKIKKLVQPLKLYLVTLPMPNLDWSI